MNNQTYSSIGIKNKNVYLMVSDTGEKKWTKNKNLALSFNTDKQAEEFGKKYFTKFKNWEVKDIEIKFN